ncbi:hypothetical protein OS035_01385 [Rhizobium sp. 268]|uniref:hypothetical protein n=1 Tax=Rhizobium sp. 268 TaxID=2996375 RepID=UPI002F92FE3B
MTNAVEQRKGEFVRQSVLDACEYRGPLNEFLGRRWWRAAIDDLSWNLSQDEHGYEAALGKLNVGENITWLMQSEPVLLSDADLVETDEIAEASECVRVTDEDFPANVDPAWVLIKLVKEDKHLRAKVVYEDRDLLDDE